MRFRLSGLAAPLLVLVLLPISLRAQQTPEPAPEEAPTASGASFEERVRTEVEELHQFFQEWFNGTVENTDQAYSRFAGVIADGFIAVSPAGVLQDRAALIEGLRGSYAPEGSEPIRVWVEKLEIRRRLSTAEGDLVVVTFEAWQQRGETRRGRLSTALLRERADSPNGVEWLQLHETWLPPDRQSQ